VFCFVAAPGHAFFLFFVSPPRDNAGGVALPCLTDLFITTPMTMSAYNGQLFFSLAHPQLNHELDLVSTEIRSSNKLYCSGNTTSKKIQTRHRGGSFNLELGATRIVLLQIGQERFCAAVEKAQKVVGGDARRKNSWAARIHTQSSVRVQAGGCGQKPSLAFFFCRHRTRLQDHVFFLLPACPLYPYPQLPLLHLSLARNGASC
jgi:hypothetical protein